MGEVMQAITRRAALDSLAPATAAAQALLMSIPARDGEAYRQTSVVLMHAVVLSSAPRCAEQQPSRPT